MFPKCKTRRFKNCFVVTAVNEEIIDVLLIYLFFLVYHVQLLSVMAVLRVCMLWWMTHNCRPNIPTGTNKVTWTFFVQLGTWRCARNLCCISNPPIAMIASRELLRSLFYLKCLFALQILRQGYKTINKEEAQNIMVIGNVVGRCR